MGKVRVALLGAGNRGKDAYGPYALRFPEDIEFVAVAEPMQDRREAFAKAHNIPKENQVETYEKLLNRNKFCDAMMICTQDDMHFIPTKTAIEKGYHVLLEKPMSNSLEECMELGKIARENDVVFMICHVLRYTPFFTKIKEIIDSGKIGKVMTIQHNENIGYFHMAHSFVRGNWRNSKESSPIILAKTCHDMDILLFLAGSRCKKISSFGSLTYFRESNAPANAADRCIDCEHEPSCIYSAKAQYLKARGMWPATTITEDQTEEGILKALAEGLYGRCAYKCDNDVCDHQVVNMEFENGITSTFNLSAFTNNCNRTLKIMGTRGEIRANDLMQEVEVQLFGQDSKEIFKCKPVGGHGGGDYGLMADFVRLIQSGKNDALTSADISVESHVMAFAAENSRVNGVSVNLEEFYRLNS